MPVRITSAANSDPDRPLSGGTTSILAFAVQNRGTSLTDAVTAYHTLSDDHAVCDYGYHLIVTDPNDVQMHTELPKLVKEGITSMKASFAAE